MQIEKIFQGYNVRIKVEGGKPFFNLGDVLKAVESTSRTANIIKTLEEDDVVLDYITDSLGRKQKSWFINEFALLELLSSLQVPKTKEFRRWVFREVIPTILKTGSYSVEKPKTLEERSLELISELNTRVEEQRKELEEARPKALSHDHWNDEQQGEMSFRDLSNKLRRYYDINERTLREHMLAKGDLAKRSWRDDNGLKKTKYVPTTKAIDKGWANEHPAARYTAYKWTPAYYAELVRRFEPKPEPKQIEQTTLFN